MGTDIRPELSEKNRYWIDRHRYYELKHFCLQYPIWREKYKNLDGYSSKSASLVQGTGEQHESDVTAEYADTRVYLANRMNMVKKAADETSVDLGKYIFKAATEGLSYEYLKTSLKIPCCKDTYYELYRRFFWLLSKARK